MRAFNTQHTINAPCSISGRGYWTGKPITLCFLPAEAEEGITFLRSDLPHTQAVQAVSEHAAGLSMRTQIGSESLKFDMVEHVMAALHGMGVDNVRVVADSEEMPGMDGSSFHLALKLQGVGLRPQSATRQYFRINTPLRVGDDQRWILAEPLDADGWEVEYQLDYGPGSPIGQASFRTRVTPETFLRELAPARTFITEAEAQYLQSQGLAPHATHQDLLVFAEHGPIDNRLRFQDECARHKALDLVGDLALAGVHLLGRITACKSGHQLNAEMTRLLRRNYLEQHARESHSSSKRVAA
mgnify:CR=1 FL=1